MNVDLKAARAEAEAQLATAKRTYEEVIRAIELLEFRVAVTPAAKKKKPAAKRAPASLFVAPAPQAHHGQESPAAVLRPGVLDFVNGFPQGVTLAAVWTFVSKRFAGKATKIQVAR